ncbi:MAG: hypothetical protein U1C96_13555, partial [Gallionella sp.]|nr:hypothetical protein [Gallionella sp.]
MKQDKPRDVSIGEPAEESDAVQTRVSLLTVREQTADVREQTADVREQTADVREKNADVREKNADVREKNADVREKNADVHEYEVRLAEQTQVASDALITLLQLANEHLVVSSIESQRLTDQQQKTQERLEEAKNAAEKASLTKSDFLSGVSHELRSPL